VRAHKSKGITARRAQQKEILQIGATSLMLFAVDLPKGVGLGGVSQYKSYDELSLGIT